MFTVEVFKGKTNTPQDYYDIAEIVLDETKTQGYHGGYGVFTDNAYSVMNFMKLYYNKCKTDQMEACAFHIIISIPYIRPGISIDNLFEYMESVSDIIGLHHQIAFGIHHDDFNIDEKTLQIHMVLNAVTWRAEMFSKTSVLKEEFVKTHITGDLYQACAHLENPLLKIENTLSFSDECFTDK